MRLPFNAGHSVDSVTFGSYKLTAAVFSSTKCIYTKTPLRSEKKSRSHSAFYCESEQMTAFQTTVKHWDKTQATPYTYSTCTYFRSACLFPLVKFLIKMSRLEASAIPRKQRAVLDGPAAAQNEEARGMDQNREGDLHSELIIPALSEVKSQVKSGLQNHHPVSFASSGEGKNI